VRLPTAECEFCERRKLWKAARAEGKRTALTKGTLDGQHQGWYVFSVDGKEVEFYKKIELVCSCGKGETFEPGWDQQEPEQD
jgi:hypothetical protein